MSNNPQIKISGIGCFVILALPCLAIWYFGMLSIAIFLFGGPLIALGAFATFYTHSKTHERLIGIAMLLTGIASFYWIYTIHYP